MTTVHAALPGTAVHVASRADPAPWGSLRGGRAHRRKEIVSHVQTAYAVSDIKPTYYHQIFIKYVLSHITKIWFKGREGQTSYWEAWPLDSITPWNRPCVTLPT